MAITTRSGKGSALTHSEMDTNLNQIPNGSNSSITDVNGNIGIGTSSPTDYSGKVLQIHADSGSASRIKLTTATSGTTITDGGSITYDTSSVLSFINREGGDILFGSPAEKLRVTPNGITFNGDTSTANALDDYEEGTWTPVCDGITPTTATGTYTKIGNICYIGIFINIGSQSSTASAIISGFPFTVKYDNNSTRAGLSCSYTTLGSMSTFLLSDNSSLGHIRKLTGSIYNWSEISSTVFHIGGTYQTT
jgi:hypothetical protein